MKLVKLVIALHDAEMITHLKIDMKPIDDRFTHLCARYNLGNVRSTSLPHTYLQIIFQPPNLAPIFPRTSRACREYSQLVLVTIVSVTGFPLFWGPWVFQDRLWMAIFGNPGTLFRLFHYLLFRLLQKGSPNYFRCWIGVGACMTSLYGYIF